jgi:anti-sigma factor RsiW
MPPVTEEDLHALVDGETDPARRDAIFSFLSGSPADTAKVDAWRRQNEAIRAGFARIEAEPFDVLATLAPPAQTGNPVKVLAAHINPAQPAKRRPAWSFQSWRRRLSWPDVRIWRNPTGPAFLLAFLAGIGAAIGIIALFDRANLGASPVEGPAKVEADDAFVNRAKSALIDFARSGESTAVRPGAPPAALILPNLSAIGLRLTGVRVVPGEKDRMICLFYAKGVAGAIALCAEAADDGDGPGFHEAEQSAHRTIWWRQKRAKYALSGALPEAELRSLANHARNEIEAFDAH